LLTRREREPETHGERLLAASRARLRTAGAQVAASERLCRELSPERTLARGFSITRGEAGRAVRSPADARPDDRISTETAGGLLWSRVEER
ncbi:MAG TPA: exodeoxyribonuclease VII large subunit, partial [Thermoanaerobaculia bacterium]|nr:exodeoxyribonuclease VII large subunit [Thermoanaerobaculia bacterium]